MNDPHRTKQRIERGWNVTTTGKSLEWLAAHFGEEGMEVMAKARRYGYRITLVHDYLKHRDMFRIDRRVANDGADPSWINYKYEDLGTLDNSQAAVDLLKVLLATEGAHE